MITKWKTFQNALPIIWIQKLNPEDFSLPNKLSSSYSKKGVKKRYNMKCVNRHYPFPNYNDNCHDLRSCFCKQSCATQSCTHKNDEICLKDYIDTLEKIFHWTFHLYYLFMFSLGHVYTKIHQLSLKIYLKEIQCRVKVSTR